MGGGGGVQGAKTFVNNQSRSLGAPLAKCLEILCAAMPYSAAWQSGCKVIVKTCYPQACYKLFRQVVTTVGRQMTSF